MCDADIMSGPRSTNKSSLINAADRFRKLGPPSVRACAQFPHLQKASGKAFAAAVPRKVRIISGGISPGVGNIHKGANVPAIRLGQCTEAAGRATHAGSAAALLF